MNTQIRGLTEAEINDVAGGENLLIGAAVVNSMWQTINDVNGAIRNAKEPAKPCQTNHHTA